MIYLYWYLGIGAVFLAVIFISHQLTKSSADDRLSELLQAADPRRDRWWWKPLNNVVVPILAAVMVLTVWPIAIYWKAKEMIDARRIKNEEPHKEFAVTNDHLQKQWTAAEIESAETVVDPLDAAPRITSVTRLERAMASSTLFASSPAAETRIAAPLPRLLYGPMSSVAIHRENRCPQPPLSQYRRPHSRSVAAGSLPLTSASATAMVQTVSSVKNAFG